MDPGSPIFSRSLLFKGAKQSKNGWVGNLGVWVPLSTVAACRNSKPHLQLLFVGGPPILTHTHTHWLRCYLGLHGKRKGMCFDTYVNRLKLDEVWSTFPALSIVLLGVKKRTL